jgi:hypothetical protein
MSAEPGAVEKRVTPRPACFALVPTLSGKKDFALQEFGFVVIFAHPGSTWRGDRTSSLIESRACGGRGSVGTRWCGQGG